MDLGSNSHRNKIILSGIFIFSFLIYARSLSNDLVWDSVNILLDPRIKELSLLKNFFFEGYHVAGDHDLNYYRPLLGVIHFLIYQIFGQNAVVFKGINLLLNSLLCCLVYVVLLELGINRTVSIIAALLYACIPVRAEAVYWVNSDSHLYVGVLLLGSFILYLREKYFLSTLIFSIALLFQEIAVVFPLILTTYALFSKTSFKSALSRLSFYFVATCAYLYIRFNVLDIQITNLSLKEWLNGSAFIITKCLKIAFWPDGKAPVYIYKTGMFKTINGDILLGYGIFTAALIFATYWLQKKDFRIFWLTWIFIFLLPAFNVGALGTYYMAEKALNLPSIGLLVLLLDSFGQTKWKTLSFGAVTALMIWYAGWTVAKASAWENTEVYLTEAIRFEKDFTLGHISLSEYYLVQKNFDKASFHIRRAQQIDPYSILVLKGLARVYNNQAIHYYEHGEHGKAEDFFHLSIEAFPFDPLVYVDLGVIQMEVKSYLKAEANFKRSLSLDPANVKATLYLAEVGKMLAVARQGENSR